LPADLATGSSAWGRRPTLPLIGSLGEAIFAEGYGMVETAGGVAIRVAAADPRSIGGSVGMPLPGVRFKVVDDAGDEVSMGGVGELWLSGPSILKATTGRPKPARERSPTTVAAHGDLARRGPLGIINFEAG